MINAAKIEKLPKVIIPVHLAGTSCDMKEIYKLSKKYLFSIIEDASHAIGGTYNTKPVGCCEYSAITVFSFHPVKIITSGEGGIATTNCEFLAEKLRILRSHGIVKDVSKHKIKNQGGWYYEQQMLGYNYRLTDIHASLGISQLRRLDNIVNERNNQLNYYKHLFKDIPVRFLKIPKGINSSVHLAVLSLFHDYQKKYKIIFEGMRSKGIGVQLHYQPIYKNPYYKKFNFNNANFPGAEDYSKCSMSIPLYPGLKRKQQIKVRDILGGFLK